MCCFDVTCDAVERPTNNIWHSSASGTDTVFSTHLSTCGLMGWAEENTLETASDVRHLDNNMSVEAAVLCSKRT